MVQAISAETYGRRFEALRPSLPGAGAAAPEHARDEAIGRFLRHGFPSQRVEAWKFTSLRPLTKAEFVPAVMPAAPVAVGDLRLAGGGPLAVFVNGRFRPDLSDLGVLPAGVTLQGLAAALAADAEGLAASLADGADDRAAALVALNAALAADGAVLRIARGTVLEAPIQLLFVAAAGGQPWMTHPRNLIVVEDGARAAVVESYVDAGAGRYWTNAVTRVAVGAGASLGHYKLQAEGAEAVHIAASRVRLARDAAYASHVLALGGALARNEIEVALAGPGASCRLDGLTLARGRQVIDSTSRIDHAEPHGTSRQTYKSVVDEAGHSVFQGRVRVAPLAQKSDAQQLNRNLLLADGAQADAKPELEILADDVKCSHGATIGDLDRESIFYLRARGLDERAARALLVEAFAAESLDGIEVEPVREAFRRALAGWLAGEQGR
jgi:Fe-S cluster assembly protein SufD